MVDQPKLVVAKIELRFDTNGTLKDCMPGIHSFLKERLNLSSDGYIIHDYAVDSDDQNARVITVQIGV